MKQNTYQWQCDCGLHGKFVQETKNTPEALSRALAEHDRLDAEGDAPPCRKTLFTVNHNYTYET